MWLSSPANACSHGLFLLFMRQVTSGHYVESETGHSTDLGPFVEPGDGWSRDGHCPVLSLPLNLTVDSCTCACKVEKSALKGREYCK